MEPVIVLWRPSVSILIQDDSRARESGERAGCAQLKAMLAFAEYGSTNRQPSLRPNSVNL